MRKIFILVVIILAYSNLIKGQVALAPICQGNYFYQSGNMGCIWYHPVNNPSVSLGGYFILPPNSSGLAIGPKFSFSAPDPTYWTVANGFYWYFNGVAFVNSGHSAGGTSFINPGGSKNFLYNLNSSGQVSVYNGTGNANILATFTNCTGSDAVQDIAGDANDNFYLIKYSSPQSMLVYDSSAVLTCSYNIASCPAGLGLAINRGKVSVLAGNSVYIGSITGNTITFATGVSLPCSIQNDLASCPSNVILTPPIRAIPNSSLLCMGGTITLASDDLIGMNTYTWSGPGITSALNSQSITLNAPGIYTRSLINCAGIADVETFTIYQGTQQPLVPYQSSQKKCGQDVPVTLSVTGLGNYTWTPSSSLSSSLGAIVFASPGATTAYTVTGLMNGCSGTTIISIAADPIPPFYPVASNSIICEGSTVSLMATPMSNLIFMWQPGNISATSITVSPSQNETYSLVATNSLGCSQTQTIGIIVVINPTINCVASQTEVCQGNAITIVSTGATNFTYSPGGNTGTMLTIVPSANTIYTITGSNWNCSESKTIAVIVHPLPQLNLSSSATVICNGESATLTATGAESYQWDTGSTNSQIIVTPALTTLYNLTGQTTFGCSSNSFILLTVEACTDINELSRRENPFIYPNPGNGIFTLNKGNISGEITIQVFNTMGLLVLMKRYLETDCSIDLGGSPSGLYTLRLSADGQIVYKSVFLIE